MSILKVYVYYHVVVYETWVKLHRERDELLACFVLTFFLICNPDRIIPFSFFGEEGTAIPTG
jgi:hypothetical protein